MVGVYSCASIGCYITSIDFIGEKAILVVIRSSIPQQQRAQVTAHLFTSSALPIPQGVIFHLPPS
ncbi:hypothetical protein E2C01_102355 [Portunus trituberculatus]|uniref:Uncharacterized protein n=1 Tax=Portunus trituberculatus TaxID=210409 RepID=A0A5B7KH37_PORTR|nr:hypothetical protein [Portunus trituberculatus]